MMIVTELLDVEWNEIVGYETEGRLFITMLLRVKLTSLVNGVHYNICLVNASSLR